MLTLSELAVILDEFWPKTVFFTKIRSNDDVWLPWQLAKNCQDQFF